MSEQQSSHESEDSKSRASRQAILILLGDIGDTTWRMFVPTIALGIGGFLLDTTLATQPVWTLAGVIIGALLGGLLVRNQLRRIKR